MPTGRSGILRRCYGYQFCRPVTMASLQLTTTVLGIFLAGSILVLVRRDHLHLSLGLFWIAVAAGSLLFGIFPGLIDHLARFANVAYAPTLFLLLMVLVLLIKSLHGDIALTRNMRQLRRLNQRMAILEAELHEQRSPGSH